MQAKAYKGMGMEGGVARWYDKTTREICRNSKRWRAEWRTLPDRGVTGARSCARSRSLCDRARQGRQIRVTGLDMSGVCVEIATRNAQQERVEVDFRQGNASQMPFAEAGFDFLLCRAAFKNFSDPVGALQENAARAEAGRPGFGDRPAQGCE